MVWKTLLPLAKSGIGLDRVMLCRRYMPILPMVLINGAEGIGTGWSTSIPNYNPRDVVANLKRYLAGEALEPMQPWYGSCRRSCLSAH